MQAVISGFTTIIGTLPNWLTGFVIMSMLITIIFLIVGRTGGTKQ